MISDWDTVNHPRRDSSQNCFSWSPEPEERGSGLSGLDEARTRQLSSCLSCSSPTSADVFVPQVVARGQEERRDMNTYGLFNRLLAPSLLSHLPTLKLKWEGPRASGQRAWLLGDQCLTPPSQDSKLKPQAGQKKDHFGNKIELTIIICGFHACKFAYLLKCICDRRTVIHGHAQSCKSSDSSKTRVSP